MDGTQKIKYKNLGLNIAYYRKSRQYTQAALCELLGVDSGYMSKIETARVGVSLDIIFNLSDILQVPAYKFFEFKD